MEWPAAVLGLGNEEGLDDLRDLCMLRDRINTREYFCLSFPEFSPDEFLLPLNSPGLCFLDPRQTVCADGPGCSCQASSLA